MVAFFPNICSPAFGWQLEDSMINELHCNELFADYSPHQQDTSNNSITSSPHPLEFDSHGIVPVENQSDSMKRSIHNKYERDRRRKLNSLYLSLRNLLPEADQTVCVLTYQLPVLLKTFLFCFFLHTCVSTKTTIFKEVKYSMHYRPCTEVHTWVAKEHWEADTEEGRDSIEDVKARTIFEFYKRSKFCDWSSDFRNMSQ